MKLLHLKEWIIFSLYSDGRVGAVARDYFDIVREGQEAVVDRLQDLRRVASGEIGSAYGAREEGVTRDEERLIG